MEIIATKYTYYLAYLLVDCRILIDCVFETKECKSWIAGRGEAVQLLHSNLSSILSAYEIMHCSFKALDLRVVLIGIPRQIFEFLSQIFVLVPLPIA